MRVSFESNQWRSWTVYHPADNFERIILDTLDTLEHLNDVLANELETTIDGMIEYSDAIDDQQAELSAILG